MQCNMRELEVHVFQDKLALLNQSTVEKTVNLPIFAKISMKELQLISWETINFKKVWKILRQDNKKSFYHGNHFHFSEKGCYKSKFHSKSWPYMIPSQKQCQEKFKVVEDDFFKINFFFWSVTKIYIKNVKGIQKEATEK